ncbi:MAG TPA: rhodanese-like domain-containing protein [Bryobacteraceae bacterium]|nr:rhodanese-like domain-containing protein [Bryobacteraceae bacterium]
MNRRVFVMRVGAAAASATIALGKEQSAAEPWPQSALMSPAALAKKLNSEGARPAVLCVAFPVLYRQRHIIHAEFAGPGSSAEGIESLKKAAANLQKNEEIVIYCGCCPMVDCPNVRPAYSTLTKLGFTNVKVLDIPTNFHTDWVAKGYPVEEQLGVPIGPAARPK